MDTLDIYSLRIRQQVQAINDAAARTELAQQNFERGKKASRNIFARIDSLLEKTKE